jgi:predicted DNA-binding protein with PD1-like motif
MIHNGVEKEKIHVIKLESGTDMLAGLTDAIGELNITSGVILCGIGSTTSAHIHVIKSDKLPPGNVFFQHTAPFDVVGMQGYIMEGKVHAHVSVGRHTDGVMLGGHLEPGTRVHTFAIITVMETSELPKLDTYKHD